MGKKFDLAGLVAGQKAVSESDTITMLPIDKLISDERNFYSVDDVQELMDSIAVSGVLQPILVARDGDGWRIIAGHRRTKAVSLLQKEWAKEEPCPYDRIPAVVRPAPTTREEELLEELALIATNSAARKLSDVEISKQAERMQALFYELKKEGYDFPGRMRTQVAKAVGVSESKLARLKTIREKLTPSWLERWETGKMTESGAEALAKLRPEVQDALLPLKMVSPERLRDIEGFYDRTHKEKGCEVRRNLQCDHLDALWKKGMTADNYWLRCETCCRWCSSLRRCKSACQRAKDAAVKADKKAMEKGKREQAEAIEKAQEGWRRLDALIPAHGISREEAEKELGLCHGIGKRLENPETSETSAYILRQTVELVCTHKSIYLLAKRMGLPPEAITDPDWKPEEKPEPEESSVGLVLVPKEAENGTVWSLAATDDLVPVGRWFSVTDGAAPPEGALVLILRFSTIMSEWAKEPHAAIYRDDKWYHPEEAAQDIEWTGVRYWSPWPEGGPEEWKEDADDGL